MFKIQTLNNISRNGLDRLPANLYSVANEIAAPDAVLVRSADMLAAFGWPIAFEPGRARLEGGHRLCATDVVVPADFSSAAFFLVAASIVPGSRLLLRAVGLNPRRTGLLQALRMGRNPKTGDSVALPGKHVPHFKPGKELRERVNANGDTPVEPT